MASTQQQQDLQQGHLPKVTVLISGSGTNLAALIKASQNPSQLPAKINRVLSNRKNAYGLIRAQEAGIQTTIWTLAAYRKTWTGSKEDESGIRKGYDIELANLVLQDSPDLVVLAGFMHILSPSFLSALKSAKRPIINLHPALPHQFNGANAIRRAYDAFQEGKIEKTGLMCHYVIEEVDEGEVICVRDVPLEKGESLEDLEQRMHTVEWEIIVEGARKALENLKSSSS